MILFLYYYHESTCMIVKQNYNTCCAFMWTGTRFWVSYQTFHQFLKIFFFQSLCYVKLFRLVHLTMYFMQLQMSECCIHLSINHRFNQYNMFWVVFFFFIALSSLLQWVSIPSLEVTGRRLILCHGSIPYHGKRFCVVMKLFLYFGRRLILHHGRIFILYHPVSWEKTHPLS